MENNKGNKDTSASKTEEKTVQPNNNSERDFVNQTGKSQNLGNDSDYLTDPNKKANPETLAEGSEFLNDSIEQNVDSGEKDADTQEFYNKENTITGSTGPHSGNDNDAGNSGPETGNSGNQNYMDEAPDNYEYIDPKDQRSRNNPSEKENEDDDTQDPRGKVKNTMMQDDENEDSADLEDNQVRRNT